ncbi:MAG TPA: diguanylate cyclase [Gammaproteobacteria bacterium]|nr:diguanylate cyclase [Gammaproteobacteria bacterium]
MDYQQDNGRAQELANRRAFDERPAESLDETPKGLKSICLLMVDIDHFKDINDRHGHQIGDKVLDRADKALYRARLKGRNQVFPYYSVGSATQTWLRPFLLALYRA